MEVNLVTGETTILQTDIIYDCGKSLNPAVDLGQVSQDTVICLIYGLRLCLGIAHTHVILKKLNSFFGWLLLQIEGAYAQGIGFFMLEEYTTNSDGLVITDNTWTYKIPTVDTIPKRFNVEILNSGNHKNRVPSSKGKFGFFFLHVPRLIIVNMELH